MSLRPFRPARHGIVVVVDEVHNLCAHYIFRCMVCYVVLCGARHILFTARELSAVGYVYVLRYIGLLIYSAYILYNLI